MLIPSYSVIEISRLCVIFGISDRSGYTFNTEPKIAKPKASLKYRNGILVYPLAIRLPYRFGCHGTQSHNTNYTYIQLLSLYQAAK